jgi:hypothetical protein
MISCYTRSIYSETKVLRLPNAQHESLCAQRSAKPLLLWSMLCSLQTYQTSTTNTSGLWTVLMVHASLDMRNSSLFTVKYSTGCARIWATGAQQNERLSYKLVLKDISAVLCEISTTAPIITNVKGTKDPFVTLMLTYLDFCLLGNLRDHCVISSCSQRRHTTPEHLELLPVSATIPACLNVFDSPWQSVPKHVPSVLEDVLSTSCNA